MTGDKALFLDRDGTIIEDRGYLSDPAGVVLIEGAKEALHHALRLGYALFLVTNQSGVGRGWYTMDDVAACQSRMLELLDLPAPGFVDVCIAPEAPDAVSPYRKPSPRFVLEQMERLHLDPYACWLVGDRLSDWECAVNAGIFPIAVRTGKPFDEESVRFLREEQVRCFESLADFVATLV